LTLHEIAVYCCYEKRSSSSSSLKNAREGNITEFVGYRVLTKGVSPSGEKHPNGPLRVPLSEAARKRMVRPLADQWRRVIWAKSRTRDFEERGQWQRFDFRK
jgi:hypothetical protein